MRLKLTPRGAAWQAPRTALAPDSATTTCADHPCAARPDSSICWQQPRPWRARGQARDGAVSCSDIREFIDPLPATVVVPVPVAR